MGFSSFLWTKYMTNCEAMTSIHSFAFSYRLFKKYLMTITEIKIVISDLLFILSFHYFCSICYSFYWIELDCIFIIELLRIFLANILLWQEIHCFISQSPITDKVSNIFLITNLCMKILNAKHIKGMYSLNKKEWICSLFKEWIF